MFELLKRMATGPRRPAEAWIAAAVLLVAAALVRLALGPWLDGYPFLTFFPAAILAALFGGWLPGVVSAAGGALAAWAFFLQDGGRLAAPSAREGFALVLYICAAGLCIAMVQVVRSLAARLRQEADRAAGLASIQEALLHELQHRTANNMQFVSSILTMQARRVESAEDARAALEQAIQRLDTLARIHRRIYDPANGPGDFGRIVEDICQDLLQATGAHNIVCRVDMAPIALAAERLATLSLIITELLANALKHAFKGRPGGTIAISLKPVTNGRYVLEVADNGIGVPPGFDPARSPRLGMRIVQSLAQRLNGTLSVTADGGMLTRIEFAASQAAN